MICKRESSVFRDYLEEKASIAFEVNNFNEFEKFIESKTMKYLFFMQVKEVDAPQRYKGPRRFDYWGRSFIYQKYTSRLICGELIIRGDSGIDLSFRFSWNPMTKKGTCIRVQGKKHNSI